MRLNFLWIYALVLFQRGFFSFSCTNRVSTFISILSCVRMSSDKIRLDNWLILRRSKRTAIIKFLCMVQLLPFRRPIILIPHISPSLQVSHNTCNRLRRFRRLSNRRILRRNFLRMTRTRRWLIGMRGGRGGAWVGVLVVRPGCFLLLGRRVLLLLQLGLFDGVVDWEAAVGGLVERAHWFEFLRLVLSVVRLLLLLLLLSRGVVWFLLLLLLLLLLLRIGLAVVFVWFELLGKVERLVLLDWGWHELLGCVHLVYY